MPEEGKQHRTHAPAFRGIAGRSDARARTLNLGEARDENAGEEGEETDLIVIFAFLVPVTSKLMTASVFDFLNLNFGPILIPQPQLFDTYEVLIKCLKFQFVAQFYYDSDHLTTNIRFRNYK